ncbi:hypothetical protein BV898_16106 [Hypsibius exemplaris]|uniref:Uncharacterized protein n=1 Tax=Hypsibius exemplaris TaxID=2072580 RepID=A0A9X6RKV2_HYPEX|nr:hypothetical protein BV898_16106 [Hypsibius exemplaris]
MFFFGFKFVVLNSCTFAWTSLRVTSTLFGMSKILLAEIDIAELHIGKRSARPANVIKMVFQHPNFIEDGSIE